jgi:hypothetical protein
MDMYYGYLSDIRSGYDIRITHDMTGYLVDNCNRYLNGYLQWINSGYLGISQDFVLDIFFGYELSSYPNPQKIS